MPQGRDKMMRYQEGVRHILLTHWDPIEVRDLPEAQGEYDSYVPGICGRLLRRAADEELTGHLWKLETEDMGMGGDRARLARVVTLLNALRDDIERAS